LVGKPEGKRPLGRPRRRWVDNIRMDLQEVGCGQVDWIGLAQDRESWRKLVSAVMNLRVPWNAGNFLTSCKPVSCSGRTLHHGISKYGVSIQSLTEVYSCTGRLLWRKCVLSGCTVPFSMFQKYSDSRNSSKLPRATHVQGQRSLAMGGRITRDRSPKGLWSKWNRSA